MICTFYSLNYLVQIWAMGSLDVGGLAFNSDQVGYMGSIAGFMAIPIQMFIYPAVVKKLKYKS